MEDKLIKSKDYLLQVFIPIAKEESKGLSDVLKSLDSIEYYLNTDYKQSIIGLIDEMKDDDYWENISWQTVLWKLKQKIEEL